MTEQGDTIAAISTPPGEGGVGMVRLSGPRALPIAQGVFISSRGQSLAGMNRRICHGHVVDAAGKAVDEVLVLVMCAPRSYTREDVVEIHGHGGAAPLNAILKELMRGGARLARPGEFTQRAFLNGRLDLVQAEAVIDQIRAHTRAGLQAANAAASGALSKNIFALRDTLANGLAHIEAAVDFPEEDLPELVNAALLDGLREAHIEMGRLLGTADAGRLYREGVTVAIAGQPNVGKSSLFNALLRDARAIVTPEPGTTRDRLEEYVTIEGVPVRLIDTAGLRETTDDVERIGVARAREALARANLVLFLVDAADPDPVEARELSREIAALGLPALLVLNKIDLAPDASAPGWPGVEFAATCRLSALTGAGIEELEALLAQLLLGGLNVAADQPMLTRMHQKNSLRRAAECLGRLIEDTGRSPEFLAFELREALDALGEITGETTPEDILDRVFAQFCIGK